MSVVALDLDDFKAINDALGHAVGDEALRTMANALRDELRAGDICGRVGGDEFMLALVAPTSPTRRADRRARARARRERALGTGQPLTVSAGIAEYPRHGTVQDELLHLADGAMYWAKSNGKDAHVRLLGLDRLRALGRGGRRAQPARRPRQHRPRARPRGRRQGRLHALALPDASRATPPSSAPRLGLRRGADRAAAHRRRAARRRQDRHPRRRPAEAREARRRRVRRHAPPLRAGPRHHRRRRHARRSRAGSCTCTSASTAAATPTASPARRSRSRAASCTAPTRSRR